VAITRQKVTGNIPNIIGVIVLILMIADTFVKGGIPIATYLRNWATLLLGTWLVVVSSVFALLNFWRIIKGRRPHWYAYVIFYISLIFTLVLGITTDLSGIYTQIYVSVLQGGTGAMSSMIAFSFIAMFLRMFLATSGLRIWTIILCILSLIPLTPLGDMFYPPLTDFGFWLINNPVAGSYSGIWFPVYCGIMALVIRIVLFREKIRAI